MRILVFGASGQVATELAHRAVGPVEIITMGRNSADFGDPGACVTALKSVVGLFRVAGRIRNHPTRLARSPARRRK